MWNHCQGRYEEIEGCGGMGSGWGWFVMVLTTIVLLSLVGLAIFATIRLLDRGRIRPPSELPVRPSPNDLLAARFARGELDETDYVRAREVLGSPPPR